MDETRKNRMNKMGKFLWACRAPTSGPHKNFPKQTWKHHTTKLVENRFQTSQLCKTTRNSGAFDLFLFLYFG